MVVGVCGLILWIVISVCDFSWLVLRKFVSSDKIVREETSYQGKHQATPSWHHFMKALFFDAVGEEKRFSSSVDGVANLEISCSRGHSFSPAQKAIT